MIRYCISFIYIHFLVEGHAGEANTRMSKGTPVGRAPTVDLRNSHLSYVITWYDGFFCEFCRLLTDI